VPPEERSDEENERKKIKREILKARDYKVCFVIKK
jgi:hypothetical protein